MQAKILIVEDSQLVSFHMKNVLETEGYEVIQTLKSGEEAIEFVKNHQPDLIMMDVMLDGRIDGIETSLIINEIRDIPIIYLTALHDRTTLDRAKPTFPYSFLNKPFSETELLSNVQISLHKHKNDIQLKAAKEQFLSVIEMMTNGLLIFDRNLEVTFVNQSAKKLFACTEADFIGSKLFADIKLYDYKTNLCLNETDDLHHIIERKSSYLNDEFVKIVFKESSVVCTDFAISKLKVDLNEGDFMIVFSDAIKELQKEQLAEEKEREKIINLLEGQESERSRISRELHDSLGQLLNVVKMKVKTGDQEAILSLLDNAIVEVSKLAKELKPSFLNDFPLKTCLEELTSQFDDLDISVSFMTNIGENDFEEEKINIYRIVQEAINNAIKHAEAKKIDIQFYKQADMNLLTIEDDGKGFDKSIVFGKHNLKNGHGLYNIIHRTKILKGEYDIESVPGKGTIVSIKF